MMTNTQAQSFILLYVPFGKTENSTYDQRSKYLTDATTFQNFLAKIKEVKTADQKKRRGTIKLNFSVDKNEENKSNIYFAIGNTQKEALKELKLSFPSALDGTTQNKYCYIELKGSIEDCFVNYNMHDPKSLFRLAIRMHHADSTVSALQNNHSKTESFDELKNRFILTLKQANETKSSSNMLKSMSCFFLSCLGNSNNNDDQKENLVEAEQQRQTYLEQNLYSKISDAQDMQSLFNVLSKFYREHRDTYSKVANKISDILDEPEFDWVRASSHTITPNI